MFKFQSARPGWWCLVGHLVRRSEAHQQHIQPKIRSANLLYIYFSPLFSAPSKNGHSALFIIYLSLSSSPAPSSFSCLLNNGNVSEKRSAAIEMGTEAETSIWTCWIPIKILRSPPFILFATADVAVTCRADGWRVDWNLVNTFDQKKKMEIRQEKITTDKWTRRNGRETLPFFL